MLLYPQVGLGRARQGPVGLGTDWQGKVIVVIHHTVLRLCGAWHGFAGRCEAWLGEVWLGKARNKAHVVE